MKDVGLRIRIDRELREQFLKVCKKEDKPAAQVLREFMRHYVDGREGSASETFVPAENETDGADQQ
jgi:predicted DNA-binding protein